MKIYDLLCRNGGVTMSRSNDSLNELLSEQKKKKSIASKIATVAILVFLVYSLYIVISQQAELNEQQKELANIKSQITAAKQENDEYTRLLSGEDESEYMKKIAIERYGYAYPNERRFYVASLG